MCNKICGFLPLDDGRRVQLQWLLRQTTRTMQKRKLERCVRGLVHQIEWWLLPGSKWLAEVGGQTNPMVLLVGLVLLVSRNYDAMRYDVLRGMDAENKRMLIIYISRLIHVWKEAPFQRTLTSTTLPATKVCRFFAITRSNLFEFWSIFSWNDDM